MKVIKVPPLIHFFGHLKTKNYGYFFAQMVKMYTTCTHTLYEIHLYNTFTIPLHEMRLRTLYLCVVRHEVSQSAFHVNAFHVMEL